MQKNNLAAFFFIGPVMAVYLFYFILPIPLSMNYSFFQWDGITAAKKFIGFENWSMLLKDKIFHLSLMNNLKLVIASILIQIPVGIILGLLLSSKLKGVRTFKILYFIPMMISAIAVGIIWKYIYEPNFGLLNGFLRLIGLEPLTKGWLGESSTAFPSVIVAVCWQHIPFYMILFSAAIAGIPDTLYEAALIDGASGSTTFFRITLPLLRNTIRSSSILALTGSLKYFGLIFVMTEGGPNHTSELMATYMYKQGFTNFRMGYGSTIATSMFVISFILSVLVLKLSRKGEQAYV